MVGDRHHRIAFGADAFDLLLDDVGFSATDSERIGRLSFTHGLEDHGVGRSVDFLRLSDTLRVGDGGVGLEGLDLDLTFRRDHLGLRIGSSPGVLQVFTSVFCALLSPVRIHHALGEFLLRERGHQFRRRHDVTDEGVDGLHIVVALKTFFDVRLRVLLAFSAFRQELDGVMRLRGVPEVVPDEGFQNLTDQIEHRTEACDDGRSLVARDVDDLTHVEVIGEAVGRTGRNGREVRVEVVRRRLTIRPVQHNVRRRNELDLRRQRVDGVHARIQRILPHTLLTTINEFAVLERFSGAGDIFTDIGHHNTDRADGYGSHRHRFNSDEERIQVVGAGQNDLFLLTFETATAHEGVAVLEGVVTIDFLAGDLAGKKRLAFLRGNDADRVVGNRNGFFKPDSKQLGVDTVHTRRDDGDLRTALTTVGEEGTRILEGVAVNALRENTTSRNGVTVLSLDDAHLPLRDGGEFRDGDRVLPRPFPEMQAGRERVSLQTSFALEGDDTAVGQGLVLTEQDELLLDETNGVFGDKPDAEETEPPLGREAEHDEHNEAPEHRRRDQATEKSKDSFHGIVAFL